MTVEEKLQQMRDDLVVLAAACNRDDQFEGASHVQQAVVVIDGLRHQIELPDEWEWPPRINPDGSRVRALESGQ